MKKINKSLIVISIVISVMMTTACGDAKVINGIKYDTYGLFNESEKKNPDIEYRIVLGNVFWSICLVETILAPIYFVGFSIYEPVGVKNPNKIIGSIE